MSLKQKRAVGLLAVGITVALAASACGTPGSESAGKNAPSVRGGTLNLMAQNDFEHLDPQRSYVASQLHLTPLLYPTLTTYKNAEGAEGQEIVPDAASDIGTPNKDASEWTFTLRDDLKWEDGKPVTCQDFKYGVERRFADIITNGPEYPKQYLRGAANFKGPYKDPKGLPSVICAGNKITYQLAKPVNDFNFTVTMAVFSAVRKDKDTKEKYSKKPFSYGPYKIASHNQDKDLKMVRNTFWDQSKDKVRKNNPDVFQFSFGQEPQQMTDRLKQDKTEDQRSIAFINGQITPEQSAEILGDENLKKRTVSGYTGFSWYIAVNTKKVTDQKCRQALQYGVDKKAYLTAFGGPAFGDPATSIVNPELKAYKSVDTYGLKNKPQGDPAKGKSLLGPQCPKNLTLAYAQTPTLDKAVAAIKDSMSRIGVTITPKPIERSKYYETVGKSAASPELVYAGWGADWPSGSTVIPPLFDGRQILPEGNQNFAQLNDPAINKEMDAAAKVPDAAKAQPLYGDLDTKVQQAGATIPLRYEKGQFMFGSKVTGAIMNANYGDVSLLNVGVSPE